MRGLTFFKIATDTLHFENVKSFDLATRATTKNKLLGPSYTFENSKKLSRRKIAIDTKTVQQCQPKSNPVNTNPLFV